MTFPRLTIGLALLLAVGSRANSQENQNQNYQSFSQLDEQELNRLVTKASSSGPQSLTAEEVVDLSYLHKKLPTVGPPAARHEVIGQLIWWWAAQRGLNLQVVIDQLLPLYKMKYGVDQLGKIKGTGVISWHGGGDLIRCENAK